MPDRFIDQYMPARLVAFGARSAPRFSTRITVADSGVEQVNENWSEPLRRFTLPGIAKGEEDYAVLEDLKDHWIVMAGPARSWPFRDPMDFSSARLTAPGVVPSFTGSDQVIGTGDGAETEFQLRKAYTRGSETRYRRIHLPIVSGAIVTINGVDPSTTSPPTNSYTISRPGGIVTFGSPPAGGTTIRWGGLFDCEVRFEADDSFEQIVRTWHAGEQADLSLMEIRPC